MDAIRDMFRRLTGSPREQDARDVRNQPGHSGVDDLKEKADELGLKNVNLDMLASLEFPLTRDQILSQLRVAGANSMLIQLVEQVPDKLYETLNDLKANLPV